MSLRRVLGLAALLAGLAVALPAGATTTPKTFKAPYDRGELCGGSGVAQQPICFSSSGTELHEAPAEPARNGLLAIGMGISGFDHSAAEVVFTPESTRAYVISADVVSSVSNTPNINLCLAAFRDIHTGYGSNCTIMLPAGPTHLQFTATLPASTPLSIEVSLDSSGGMLGGPASVRVSQFTVS